MIAFFFCADITSFFSESKTSAKMTGRGRGNIIKLLQAHSLSESSGEDSGLGTGTGTPGFGRGSLLTSQYSTVSFCMIFIVSLEN